MKDDYYSSVSNVIKHNLCCGCGICFGACVSGAVSIAKQNGMFVPWVDEIKCQSKKGCGRCLRVCPGLGVGLRNLAEEFFKNPDIKEDYNAGRYLKCFTGYSADRDIRYRSASGGMVSQFLIFLLEQNYIDGAVVTTFDANNEFLVKTAIARTKEDILRGRSSKYGPVSMHEAVSELRNDEGRFVVVGLPCHIQGFRKLAAVSSLFRKKIIGYFSIYCSESRTFHLTEYVFKERGIDKSKLQYFAYRDEGCLGSMVTLDKNGSKYSEPYQSYYHPLRSFFIPRRCISCVDHYGELGDICFGDIHLGDYKKDKIGINSVLVRNQIFVELLMEAKKAGYVLLDKISINTLNKSQAMLKHKKQRSKTIIKIDKLLKRAVPVYDIELNDSHPLKSLLSYVVTTSQMYIGARKSLWPLIKLLKRKPNITA